MYMTYSIGRVLNMGTSSSMTYAICSTPEYSILSYILLVPTSRVLSYSSTSLNEVPGQLTFFATTAHFFCYFFKVIEDR